MEDLWATRRRYERLLVGKRLLIVESDQLIAGLMADDLEEAGAVVLGPARSATAALAFLGHDRMADGALLDVDLEDDVVRLLAAELKRRGVPVVFSSILSRELLASGLKGEPLLHKAAETWEVGLALFG